MRAGRPQATLRYNPFDSSSYPEESFGWGFSGWSITEFDVAADGHTENQRTVLAYPPFVFGPATRLILKKAIYTQSYRPKGELGCGGSQAVVKFQMN